LLRLVLWRHVAPVDVVDRLFAARARVAELFLVTGEAVEDALRVFFAAVRGASPRARRRTVADVVRLQRRVVPTPES
jgi:hypothetical protein